MGKTELSPRQLRVGEKIKHILAEFLLLHKIVDPALENKFITLSEVRMSPDLKIATCYFTAFGEADPQPIQAALNRHARYIKGSCSKELRHMKYIPDLRFRYDTSFDNFNKIDKLLNCIDVKPDSE